LLVERSQQARAEALELHAEERQDIENQMAALWRRRLVLDREVEEALEPFEEQAGSIREIANRRLAALREEDLGLPEVEAEEDPEGTRGWLYDSGWPGASAGF
jgi:F0F1-type ATP synthase membrane subunit b/b'